MTSGVDTRSGVRYGDYMTTTTCTIVTAVGGRCGAPAVTTFTSARTGEVFAECEAHAVATPAVEEAAPAAHPPTRTACPFVLVKHGKIVGYAEAITPRVRKRAARLGAAIVPVVK
jgi:hypothetical protein